MGNQILENDITISSIENSNLFRELKLTSAPTHNYRFQRKLRDEVIKREERREEIIGNFI